MVKIGGPAMSSEVVATVKELATRRRIQATRSGIGAKVSGGMGFGVVLMDMEGVGRFHAQSPATGAQGIIITITCQSIGSPSSHRLIKWGSMEASKPPTDEPADHQLNVQPAAQSSMDDGASSSNHVPISQGMEVPVSDHELQSLSPPEASFAAVDDVHVDEHCIPCCPEDQKPQIGMSFPSVELAVDFYHKYALLGSFDVRCGTTRNYKDGTVKKKYFYCNRQGFPVSDSYDTSNGKRIRNCLSQRCGCQASMVIEHMGSFGYVVSEFVEAHNHRLATGLSKANTGPVKAPKIAKQLYGDYANVGAQDIEFRNFYRDVVQYIGEQDAQMVLDNLAKKKKLCSSYFYEYSIVNGVISRIFWADPTSQLHFQAFGDVVTFDATYSLNRYKMIFVPFTGIDNHKNSITFAATLLSREDVESYTWLLNSFLKCMGRAPNLVLTDQDPSLRVVVPKVMPDTHHRFYIWHIMRKLSVKVGYSTPRSQEFRSKMKSLVYDYHIETKDFEDKWIQLMAEYEMFGHKWLSKMFRLREFWIPAFFRDIPLGGLLRTTSRSESQNSFFGSFLNKDMTLVAFFLNFNSALESQRQTKCKCDTENLSKKLLTKTPLSIEVDALNHYTRKVFQDAQTEICASCFDVSVIKVFEHENVITHEIQDPGNQHFVYTCKIFVRVGSLCRHVFAAFKSAGIEKIPVKFVLNRWTKTVIETAIQAVVAEQELWTEFNACLNIAANDIEKTEYIHHKLKEMRVHLQEVSAGEPDRYKSTIIGELIGASKPTELLVKPPAVVHTKGSGKRLQSEFEKAINKPERAP
ncbi:hypothetical protein QQ045_020921 [Rhodiola kirilowii]